MMLWLICVCLFFPPYIQSAMPYPRAHTVLEAAPLESRDFEQGSVDAVLVSDASLACSVGKGREDLCHRISRWLKPGTGRVVMGLLGSGKLVLSVCRRLLWGRSDMYTHLFSKQIYSNRRRRIESSFRESRWGRRRRRSRIDKCVGKGKLFLFWSWSPYPFF